VTGPERREPRPVRNKALPAATRLYGIRHHGPGSARSLRAALAEQSPDVVLIEGPAEADGLVALAGEEDMRPPVALLGYVPGQPETAAFWPFAVFSPEWQAIRYALGAGVPVRFCDLPAACQLAMRDGPALRSKAAQSRTDPIGELAAAAGYDDPERWWEDVVEHVPGPSSVFGAIAHAIAILRADDGEPGPGDRAREAHMRKVLRQTVRAGYQRIAVVCGAWHVPALATLPPAAADDRVLRGLPKVKATLTWVPWTYGRLAYASGYGAGVRSPGWYDHLFSADGQPVERWLAKAAAVLRDQGVPASSAHVIESVRLAEALAALRGRPLAGLEEVTEAARAVLCEGSDLLTGLIQQRLVVGERLGRVPAATPMVPLQRDLHDQQRTLRLRPEAKPRDYDLDLRKPNDLARSHLLHRLALLGVRWGAPRQDRTRNIGTFRESWQLTWRPELDLALIEASTWGSTVAAAATQRARALAAEAAALEELTALVERCLLADLGDALPDALAAVRDRAALEDDVTHLMAALPALVRAARYGDVRGTDPARLGGVAAEMITRICAGLPAAVTSLDETAERAMRDRIDAVHAATGLLAAVPGGSSAGADTAGSRARWLDTLGRLSARCPPLISGRLTRLLLDAGRLSPDDAAARMSRELSAAAPPAAAAGWAEGFLAGSGLLLLHDDKLLSLADGWLAGLSADAFTTVLPALRRTFGEFAPPERRAIGEKTARLDGTGRAPARSAPAGEDLDQARAAIAVRAVAAIMSASRPVAVP
jgi:Family of unknown function (DUF5682)